MAQAAAEVVLALLSRWSKPPLKPDPKWHELMAAAEAVCMAAKSPLSQALVSQLNASHGLRNQVIHRGVVAPREEAQDAVDASRDLLDVLPGVSAQFRALGKGMGLAGAVAELIDAEEVEEALREAEGAIAAQDPGLAADGAGRALGRALARCSPGLGIDEATETDIMFASLDRLSNGLGGSGDGLGIMRRLDERVRDVERWLLATMIGMRPVDYVRLRKVLGRWTFLGGPGLVDELERSIQPSPDDAAWSVRQVAQIVYRLHEVGALIEGPRSEVWDRAEEMTE